MGPCSWLNILPKDEELYYSGEQFKSKNHLFSEKIEKTQVETFGQTDENVDQVIFLPIHIEKKYVIKNLNNFLREYALKKEIPKKFLSKTEISIEAENVPMSVRTCPYHLNVSDAQKGLSGKCENICKGQRSILVIKDVISNEPSVKCERFHWSHTNGTSEAPILKINQTIKGDCYCTKI